MMMNLLALSSGNWSEFSSHDYRIDPRSAFKECKSREWVQPNHGKRKLIRIGVNESKCLWGSFMIGSNSSYTVTAALPVNVNGTWNWDYKDPVDNALAILATYNETGFIEAQPVAKIQCKNEEKECHIQVLPVMPSFNSTRKVNIRGIETTIRNIQTTVISTGDSGSATLKLHKKVKKTSNTSKLIENSVEVGFFASREVSSFTFTRTNGTGYYTSIDGNFKAHYPVNLTGNAGNSRTAFFYPVINERELHPRPKPNGTEPFPPRPDQNGTQLLPPRPDQNGTQPFPPRQGQDGQRHQHHGQDNERKDDKKPGQDDIKQVQDDRQQNKDDKEKKDQGDRKPDQRKDENDRERIAGRDNDDEFERDDKDFEYDLTLKIDYAKYVEKSASEDSDDTVYFFPTLTATLSANGGVFTADNININAESGSSSPTTTKTTNKSLIAIITVSCVAAIAVVAAISFFIIRSKTKSEKVTDAEFLDSMKMI